MTKFLQTRQRPKAAAKPPGAASPSTSLELSREEFVLPELPGKTERKKIRAAIARRHVSR